MAVLPAAMTLLEAAKLGDDTRKTDGIPDQLSRRKDP
jgi:hypothetical protein